MKLIISVYINILELILAQIYLPIFFCEIKITNRPKKLFTKEKQIIYKSL